MGVISRYKSEERGTVCAVKLLNENFNSSMRVNNIAERVTEVWTEILCTCNVNHGITIISTIEVIKGFTTGFVSHSILNVYIFCTRNRIGFTKMEKKEFYIKGQRGNAFQLSVSVCGIKIQQVRQKGFLKTIILKSIECRVFKTPSGILHIIKISHKDNK